MAKRSADPKPRRGNAPNPLIDMGMLNIPNFDEMDDDECDDEDLEAELSAILGGKAQAPKKKPAPKPSFDLNAIEKMATAAVSEDSTDEDGNLSDDPDLMAELHKLSQHAPGAESVQPPPPPSAPQAPLRQESLAPPATSQEAIGVAVLQERLQSYTEAEAAAKAMGDSSKARRYRRALKTLEGLVKQAQAGKSISGEDLPPPVSLPKGTSASPEPTVSGPKTAKVNVLPEETPSCGPKPIIGHPTLDHTPVPPPRPILRPAPPPPPAQQPSPKPPTMPPQREEVSSSKPASQSTDQLLRTRRDQYRNATVLAKKQGDTQTALKYLKIAKEFDAVLQALANGQPVDLSKMPPPPSISAWSPSQGSSSTAPRALAAPAPAVAPTSPSLLSPSAAFSAVGDAEVPSDSMDGDDQELFHAPPPPTSVMEALKQRLEKFQATATEAKEKGESSRARRVGRIVKQYEEAIKLYKAGKPVVFEELPAPPGFGPIPVSSAPLPPAKQPITPQETSVPAADSAAGPSAQAPLKPVPRLATQPSSSPAPRPAAAQPPPASVHPRKPMRRTLSTTMDKQLQFLKERQRLFREAAIEAKRCGDIEQAKEYLRLMKGIGPMVQATEAGLPVDATSIPVPPQLQEQFVKVEASECVSHGGDDATEEEFRTLERELIDQHQMCINNKDHFFKLGDVASGTKFEKLAQEVHRDILVMKNLWKRGDQLPKFHYEARIFSIVRSHTDLSDNELEVTIVRGINLPGKPDDLDSYIMVTFPFPTDEPQTSRTKTIKDTNNPEYNDTFKFEINRKSRGLARIMKRQPIKLEIWAKRGFLRSDAIIGQVAVKFDELESKCEMHDSYDVYDNKKPTGGKLEVKIRVREPFVSKQVEEIKQRWLIIGS